MKRKWKEIEVIQKDARIGMVLIRVSFFAIVEKNYIKF